MFGLATFLVLLGAYLSVAAISMPGVLLAALAAVPLLDGVRHLVWPDEAAASAPPPLVER